MNTEAKLKRLHSIRERIKFLGNLVSNPKFYRTIGDVLSDPVKLDMTLGTLCYAALFISSLIKRFPQIKNLILRFLGQLLVTLNKVILRILPDLKGNVTLKKLIIDPKNQEQMSEKSIENFWSKTSNILQSFSGYLTDIRIFNRGFSIPVCIADILESNSILKEKNYVDWLATISISLYQPLETIAFLFDHNWLFPDRKSNNCLWWYAVSTRFWFLWVILELSKLVSKILKSRGKGIDISEFVGLIEHLATLPLCVHWSLEEGCLDPIYVGFFGTIAGGLSTSLMWKNVWAQFSKELRLVSKESIN